MPYIISVVGYLSLLLALILSIVNFILGLIEINNPSFRKLNEIFSLNKKVIYKYSKANFYLINFLIFIGFMSLFAAIILNQFNIGYVYSVSSSDLELKYKWAALYSSQEGSLLLWSFVLSASISLFIKSTMKKFISIQMQISMIFAAILVFTLIPLVFFTSPFTISTINQIEGQGLNPLLLDPTMLIHPPMLLSGLISTAIPFAIAVATGIWGNKKLLSEWNLIIKKWILCSIFLLTLGNILGAWWAYTVLGWGGFWGWDPVENSAILALLPMIALLHTTYMSKTRSGFEYINILLGFLGFLLAIFTTFNVRSGMIDSVHSFAESDIGLYYLIYLSFLIIVSTVALSKSATQKSIHIPSLLSKESTIIINVFINLMIALAILSTLILPIIFELIKNEKIIISPDFYNQTIGSLLLILLIALSMSTMLPGKFISNKKALNELRPLFLLLSTFFILAILTNFDNFLPIFGITCSLAICYGSLKRIIKNIRLPLKDYASHLTHIGIAIFAIGAISATAFQTQHQFTINPNESYKIGEYEFKFKGIFSEEKNNNNIDVEALAKIEINKNNKLITELNPGKRFFENYPSQPVAIVDIHRGFTSDIYIFIQSWNNQLKSQFHVYFNPFINLLWLGGGIYLIGIMMAMLEKQRN
jgi:cytochrome c-type biogenesis protein CcmF